MHCDGHANMDLGFLRRGGSRALALVVDALSLLLTARISEWKVRNRRKPDVNPLNVRKPMKSSKQCYPEHRSESPITRF